MATERTASTLAWVLGGAVGLAGCDAPTNGPGGGAGLDIALPSIDGEDVRLTPQSGNELFVLTFWATWCQPCQSELAKMDEMYRALAPRGLHVYAVSIDAPDTVAQVATWSRREGYSFPVLLDRETEILGRYNPKGDIPFYVVLDANGNVLRAHQGYVDGDVKELTAFVDGLLPSE